MNSAIKLILVITVQSLMFNGLLQSQPVQVWASMFHANSVWTTGLSIDSSGNLIMAGNINRQQSFLSKYDNSGNQLWAILIPDIPVVYSSGSNIVIDNENNIYITGQNITKAVTKKYAPDGVNVWTKDLSLGSYSLGSSSINIDLNSNIYVCQGLGGFYETGNYLVKYSSEGDIIWKKKSAGSMGSYVTSLNIDNLNCIIIAGSTQITIANFLTTKYAENGDSLWSSYYGSSLINICFASVLDQSNKIFVTGESERRTDGILGKLTTIKYGNNGVEKWVRKYSFNNTSQDRGEKIVIDRSGSIIVTGRSRSSREDLDIVTIKYSQNGDSLWVKRYNGEANLNDIPYAMVSDSLDKIYITGYSTNKDNIKEIITLKYDSNGQLQWTIKYKHAFNTIGRYIVGDPFSNLYVAGSGEVNSNGPTAVCIKYSQVIGIEPVSGYLPTEFKLHNVFPNPFNPAANIRFSIPERSFVSIKIYDVLGSEVQTLVGEEMPAGDFQTTWNASGFPSGIYFYAMETTGFRDTKKMILIK